MKKVLSIALVLCMLMALCVPMSVSAWEYDPGDITNTSEIFEGTSNTGLGAYKVTDTPDLTETTGSLKDSAWDNAVALPLNITTKSVIKNATFNDGVNADFYFLWDDTYLYILEEYKNTAIGEKNKDLSSIGDNFENWRNTHTSSLYNIMLPSDTTLSGVMVTVMPNGNATVGGDILEGLVRVRYYTADISYEGTSNPSKTKVPTSDSRLDVATRTQKTETGFMQETKVSWSTLTSLSGINFTPAVAAKIGIKIGTKPADGVTQVNYHINHSGNDYLGHDCLTLLEEKTDEDRTVKGTVYTPDTAYWQTNLTTTTGEIFEISTPERLLGLADYLTNSTSDDQNLTIGDTFKLTADIDLNPGFDLTKFVPDGYYWEVPANIWSNIDVFSGTFDGQGHTVSGLYHYNGDGTGNGNGNDFGFIGRLKDNGMVKNLIIDNGYFQIDSDDSCVGGIIGTIHTSDGIIDNVYVGSGMTLDVTPVHSKNVGGILGSTWGSGEHSFTISNSKCDATLIAGTAGAGGIAGWIQKGTLTVTDSVYTKSATSNVSGLTGGTANAGTINTPVRTYAVTDATSATAALTAAPGYMVETTKGVMPVKLADMMSKYKWQSTVADATTDKYSVRIVSEVASMDYNAVGFKVQLYKNGLKATTVVQNVDNTAVYTAVKAAGSEFGASTFNAGFLDGADNKLFVITLNNLTDADTWTVEVKAVYTIGTDTIESAVAHTTTVSAYVPAAQ